MKKEINLHWFITGLSVIGFIIMVVLGWIVELIWIDTGIPFGKVGFTIATVASILFFVVCTFVILLGKACEKQ